MAEVSLLQCRAQLGGLCYCIKTCCVHAILAVFSPHTASHFLGHKQRKLGDGFVFLASELATRLLCIDWTSCLLCV